MLLYHGVNKDMDADNGGEVLAKGEGLKEARSWNDSTLKWNDEILPWDSKETGAVILHQMNSDIYKSSWVSTSKCEKIVRGFATYNGVSGWVYVFDTDMFKANGVVKQPELAPPPEPHLQEVSIANKNGGPIPKAVIVDKYRVEP